MTQSLLQGNSEGSMALEETRLSCFGGANIEPGLRHLVAYQAADGTGLVNLTNNPATDVAPAWSPNGTKIAFISGRDGNFEIYVMNADGSNQTRLTTDPRSDFNRSWSP